MISFVYKKAGRRLWRGRFRLDGDPQISDIPLRTRDKQDAEQKLRDHILELHQERAGIIAPKPLRVAAQRGIREHLNDYIADIAKRGRDVDYGYNVDKIIRRLVAECNWSFLRDITPDSFLAWRNQQAKAPKTLNEYLATMSTFLNWLVRQRRLPANPLSVVGSVEVRGLERRKRRALSADEVKRLLAVADQRAVVYIFALLTGLRRSEIAALIWADVHLDVPRPYLIARASCTKNRRDAILGLHRDLLSLLRSVRPPRALPSDPVFPRVPSMYWLKKDLAAAGIPYKDVLGRQADFHALRHTFGTNLSLAGVLPRVAMELMRHSDMRLTMKVYTDANLLPTGDGIDLLPSLTFGAR